jgi:alpha-D-xyloside xylohydrolase
MTFDPTAFVRLDALQSLDRSASGMSLATSTGDILEVTCYGPGVFRMRMGPSTQPDYGLVVGRTKACTVEQGEGGGWKFTAGESMLEIMPTPLRFRLSHRDARVAQSITDEHFRGWTRLPAFGRRRQGGHWTAALALASGEPVYGLGEKFGPLVRARARAHGDCSSTHRRR